ncbi:hypothetical protein BWQ92_05105 [Arthrobacter sp. QXT-31]|nr:hypothetical protein BWQ92_05105 [Arthrobacter sp. QXT-31]
MGLLSLLRWVRLVGTECTLLWILAELRRVPVLLVRALRRRLVWIMSHWYFPQEKVMAAAATQLD